MKLTEKDIDRLKLMAERHITSPQARPFASVREEWSAVRFIIDALLREGARQAGEK